MEKNKKTLHQVIADLIKGTPSAVIEGLSISQLTSSINDFELYFRKDGKDVPRQQVIARIRAYPDRFKYDQDKKQVFLLGPGGTAYYIAVVKNK